MIIIVLVVVVIIIIFVMMVNLDNSGSSAQASSVGFGLEDLIHLNNNNHEGDKVSRDKTDIEKVRRMVP